MSEESRKKMSLAKKGKEQPNIKSLLKHIKENGAWNKGKSKANGDILLYGQPRSQETKKLISKRLKGRKKSQTEIENHRRSVKGRHLSPETEFKKGELSNEKNPLWKGKDVSYSGAHHWIARHRGKPHYCEHCKRSDLGHRQYNWANISGEYKRDLNDYIRLCAKCHKKYDATLR